MNVDKISQHESMVSVHWTISLGHITIIRTSCFDTDFASQMKLTKLPLIHCFVLMSILYWAESIDSQTFVLIVFALWMCTYTKGWYHYKSKEKYAEKIPWQLLLLAIFCCAQPGWDEQEHLPEETLVLVLTSTKRWKIGRHRR